MKREIKFRGRNEKWEWVYGDILHMFGNSFIYNGSHSDHGNDIPKVNERDGVFIYDDELSIVDENTVGQFTGLKDKNGVEIYEGDILRVKEFENAAISTFGRYESETIDTFSIEECKGKLKKEFVSEVKYEDSSFLISEDKECDTFMTVLHLDMKHTCPIFEFEVIGNVYDNPELLNK